MAKWDVKSVEVRPLQRNTLNCLGSMAYIGVVGIAMKEEKYGSQCLLRVMFSLSLSAFEADSKFLYKAVTI